MQRRWQEHIIPPVTKQDFDDLYMALAEHQLASMFDDKKEVLERRLGIAGAIDRSLAEDWGLGFPPHA